MNGEVRHFVHGEAELSEVTGLHEKKLRSVRVRSLRQSEHWEIQGQRVAYTAVGAQLVIEAILGRETTPEELRAALEGSRAAPPEKSVPPLMGKVAKTFPNPWLLAVVLADGHQVTLRVKSSKNFRRGMEVPIRVAAGGQYELARKLPRFPGKW